MTVLEYLRGLIADRFGCEEEDVFMAANLDELNLSADDRTEIALCLQDLYGVEISSRELDSFETVEDLVGYVEDRM